LSAGEPDEECEVPHNEEEMINQEGSSGFNMDHQPEELLGFLDQIKSSLFNLDQDTKEFEESSENKSPREERLNSIIDLKRPIVPVITPSKDAFGGMLSSNFGDTEQGCADAKDRHPTTEKKKKKELS
jgi:hypothetical protein